MLLVEAHSVCFFATSRGQCKRLTLSLVCVPFVSTKEAHGVIIVDVLRTIHDGHNFAPGQWPSQHRGVLQFLRYRSPPDSNRT